MNPTPAESGHVARTIGALEMLAQQTHSVVSLAEGLEVHPRTVKRMLEALVQLQYVGVVSNDHGQALYRATLKLTTLSERLLHDSDLIQISAPYVAELRDITGEAAHLSMGSRDGVSHVLQEAGQSLVIAKPRAGEYVPFYATAVGKALLAFQDEYWDYLPERFVPFTRHTVTSRAQLQERLLEVRRTGISQDALENSLELRCLAAPICDATGVIAALGISAPSSRFTLDLVPRRSQQVLRIATELSAHLGGDLSDLISRSAHATQHLDHQP